MRPPEICLKKYFLVQHLNGKKVGPVSGIQVVVYNCFLRTVVRQSHANVTSFHMQFEKIGCGLLQEAFQSKMECFVSRKRKGEIICKKKQLYTTQVVCQGSEIWTGPGSKWSKRCWFTNGPNFE